MFKLTHFARKPSLTVLVILLVFISEIKDLGAISLSSDKYEIGFIKDPLKLQSSYSINVKDKIKQLYIPAKILLKRAKLSQTDQRIEEVSISVPVEMKEFTSFIKNLARPHKIKELYDSLAPKLYKSNDKVSSQGTKKITLDYDDLLNINLDKLQQQLARTHHQVTIPHEVLAANRSGFIKFYREQLRHVLDKKALKQIKDKFRTGEDLIVDEDLLTPFARKMTQRYIRYRGPNCFHAALAFHSRLLTRSPYFNVKRETGYHEAMINYDELWRTLNLSFYEVDAHKTPLKYGDILVFFDLPAEPQQDIYFRWIRHAAVYLFGPYTFSKGSKSPDTPYSVKTINEEWTTWSKYTKNLGVKVYRPLQKSMNNPKPIVLNDWIF